MPSRLAAPLPVGRLRWSSLTTCSGRSRHIPYTDITRRIILPRQAFAAGSGQWLKSLGGAWTPLRRLVLYGPGARDLGPRGGLRMLLFVPVRNRYEIRMSTGTHRFRVRPPYIEAGTKCESAQVQT